MKVTAEICGLFSFQKEVNLLEGLTKSESKRFMRGTKHLKIYLLLSLCLGMTLLAGCAGTTRNSDANAAAANDANKSVNPTANPTNRQATATPVAEQTASKTNFAGNWDSERFNVKGKQYTQLSLFIKQSGENISGTYSVVDYIGGDPQIEDGNQTPFTGTVKGNVATIKFDPDATVPGYEENVKYKEPADGKAPSTATLTFADNKLQWKLASGASPFEIPNDIVLNKAK